MPVLKDDGRKGPSEKESAPTARTSRRSDPLLEASNARAPAERDFITLFSLIYCGVAHELNKSISFLFQYDDISALRGKPPDTDFSRISAETIRSFKRLRCLHDLINGSCDHAEELGTLSPGQIERLAIRKDRVYHARDQDAFRVICLEEVRRLGSSLSHLCSKLMEDDSIVKEEVRLILVASIDRYGNPLCRQLESLLLGEFRLDDNARRIDIARIKIELDDAAAQCSCAYKLDIEDEVRAEAVNINPVTIKLIFLNIFSNAVRAIKLVGDGKPMVEVGVSSGGDERVVFSFRDHGCGMERDVMDKLNGGQRTTTKTDPGDHGVGFQYCRSLAELLGGRLYVKECAPGEGTTVAFELPLASDIK